MARQMVCKKCKYCGGKGRRGGTLCPACHGKGIQMLGIFETDRPTTLYYKTCGTCGGDGVYCGKTCPTCGGSGEIILDIHPDY